MQASIVCTVKYMDPICKKIKYKRKLGNWDIKEGKKDNKLVVHVNISSISFMI